MGHWELGDRALKQTASSLGTSNHCWELPGAGKHRSIWDAADLAEMALVQRQSAAGPQHLTSPWVQRGACGSAAYIQQLEAAHGKKRWRRAGNHLPWSWFACICLPAAPAALGCQSPWRDCHSLCSAAVLEQCRGTQGYRDADLCSCAAQGQTHCRTVLPARLNLILRKQLFWGSIWGMLECFPYT